MFPRPYKCKRIWRAVYKTTKLCSTFLPVSEALAVSS
jgi:hypothetical protein